jgi:endonuclease G
VVKVQKLVITLILTAVWLTGHTQTIFTIDNAQPSSSKRLQVVNHTYYRIGYSNDKKVSAWVAYILTKDMVESKAVKRKQNFVKDKSVKHSAVSSDYSNSGYDRGHLCPAADMAWSADAMNSTFLMTNISPQKPAFNQKKWKMLEEKVRMWAKNNDSIMVIAGAILDTCNYGTIGKNDVLVPCRFYKIVIDISYPTYKAAAFIMDNTNEQKPLASYVVSISDIEKATGLDFFPSLKADSTIREIEKDTMNVHQNELIFEDITDK